MHKPLATTGKMIATFTDHYPFVGPVFWIASIQYYLVQFYVSLAWPVHFSWLANTISDLGNTMCGYYNQRYVCSPQHALMNSSFIALGITMIIGAVLIYREFKASIGTAVGFSFMALAGFGTILVGLFPENTIHNLHTLGATLPFFVGNLGLVILGLSLDIPKSLRLYTLLSGFVSLVGLALFISQQYLGLGIGGIERVTAYPQTIWIIVFGIYISKNHFLEST